MDGTKWGAARTHVRRRREGEREVVVGKVDWRYVWRRWGIGGSAGGAGAGRCGGGDVGDGFGELREERKREGLGR